MLQCKIMFYNNYYFLWWKLLKIYNQNHIFGVSRWLLMAFHSIMIKTNMWRKSKAFCGFIFYHMQWKLNKLHNFRRNKKQWNTVKPNPYSDIFLAALFVSLSSVLLLEKFKTFLDSNMLMNIWWVTKKSTNKFQQIFSNICNNNNKNFWCYVLHDVL